MAHAWGMESGEIPPFSQRALLTPHPFQELLTIRLTIHGIACLFELSLRWRSRLLERDLYAYFYGLLCDFYAEQCNLLAASNV
jgi:hypothetical protein